MSTTFHINKITGEVYVETDNMHEAFTVCIQDDSGTYFEKPEVLLNEPEIFANMNLEAANG